MFDGDNARKADDVHTTRFPSLSACLSHAMKSPFWGNNSSGRSWQGGTFEEAHRWATQGWPEGAREATAKSRRVVERALQSTSAMALTHVLEYDVAGGAYDVGALCSGVPECWIRPEPQHVRRAISLCVNITASGGVTAETLKARGIAVASLVLSLQAVGHPVTVDVCQVITAYDGITRTTATRVIDASTGSQLDVDRLVYAIAHPTMFRCIYRAALETNQHGHGEWSGNPESNSFPGDYDLKLGGVHLYEVERWRDGGEAWVLAEFEKQTQP